MFLYNVTVKIDTQTHDEWLQWMRTIHVPEVMATGLFVKNHIARLLEQDDSEGFTYAFQYFAPNRAALQQYFDQFAPKLQADHRQRYDGKFVAFRTILEILD